MENQRTSNSSSLEEGIVRFHTPRSRFSTNHDNGEDPPAELDVEPSRLLSEVENQILNARIDQLVDALTSGRTLVFDQDLETGRVDVSAGYSDTPLQREEGDLEANVAAFPENFGNIVSNRGRMFRSPTSVLDSWSTTDSLPNAQVETLEDLIAAVDLSIDGQPGSPLQRDADIRRAVRQLEREAGDLRGSRLARMGSNEIEIDRVCPMPLNFNRSRPARTPSMQSGRSQLDRSSPNFMISYRRWVQNANEGVLESSSHESGGRTVTPDRVFEWMDRIEVPPHAESHDEDNDKAKNFDVLRDVPATKTGSKPMGLVSKVLKDVSNLRQPGYLQHNSFAVDKDQGAANKRARSPELPSLGFGGALNELKATTENSGVRPSEAIPGTNDPGREESVAHDRDQRDEKTTGSMQEPIDPERAAHFEFALARLEGRAPPQPSSPIQRLVNPHSTYGSDVEVELRRLHPRQPIAIRYQTGGYTVAQQFENTLRQERRRERGA